MFRLEFARGRIRPIVNSWLGIVAAVGLLAAAFNSLTLGTGHELRTITITGNDTMRFDTTAFEVAAGERVRLVLINVGNLPKAAMGHNLIILKKGVNLAAFAQSALPAAATDYIPVDKKDDIVVHTKLLGPGESDTIEFTAPSVPGNYDYLCSFPGHWALMKGIMTVK
jgi:azurin